MLPLPSNLTLSLPETPTAPRAASQPATPRCRQHPTAGVGAASLPTLRTRGAQQGRVVAGRGGRGAAAGGRGALPPCSGPLSPCTDFTFSDTVVQSSHVPLPHCFIIIKMLLCISFNHFKIKDELPRTFSLSLPWCVKQGCSPHPPPTLQRTGLPQEAPHTTLSGPGVAHRYTSQVTSVAAVSSEGPLE